MAQRWWFDVDLNCDAQWVIDQALQTFREDEIWWQLADRANRALQDGDLESAFGAACEAMAKRPCVSWSKAIRMAVMNERRKVHFDVSRREGRVGGCAADHQSDPAA